jgi:hypothetical protein
LVKLPATSGRCAVARLKGGQIFHHDDILSAREREAGKREFDPAAEFGAWRLIGVAPVFCNSMNSKLSASLVLPTGGAGGWYMISVTRSAGMPV